MNERLILQSKGVILKYFAYLECYYSIRLSDEKRLAISKLAAIDHSEHCDYNYVHQNNICPVKLTTFLMYRTIEDIEEKKEVILTESFDFIIYLLKKEGKVIPKTHQNYIKKMVENELINDRQNSGIGKNGLVCALALV